MLMTEERFGLTRSVDFDVGAVLMMEADYKSDSNEGPSKGSCSLTCTPVPLDETPLSPAGAAVSSGGVVQVFAGLDEDAYEAARRDLTKSFSLPSGMILHENSSGAVVQVFAGLDQRAFEESMDLSTSINSVEKSLPAGLMESDLSSESNEGLETSTRGSGEVVQVLAGDFEDANSDSTERMDLTRSRSVSLPAVLTEHQECNECLETSYSRSAEVVQVFSGLDSKAFEEALEQEFASKTPTKEPVQKVFDGLTKESFVVFAVEQGLHENCLKQLCALEEKRKFSLKKKDKDSYAYIVVDGVKKRVRALVNEHTIKIRPIGWNMYNSSRNSLSLQKYDEIFLGISKENHDFFVALLDSSCDDHIFPFHFSTEEMAQLFYFRVGTMIGTRLSELLTTLGKKCVRAKKPVKIRVSQNGRIVGNASTGEEFEEVERSEKWLFVKNQRLQGFVKLTGIESCN